MSRELKKKELVSTRLANNYGGWIYCDQCNKNIGYLCYVTYDAFKFDYTCNCGSKGSCFLEFEDTTSALVDRQSLLTIKNRCCCPNDQSPLFTVISKNVTEYNVEVVCKTCGHKLNWKNTNK